MPCWTHGIPDPCTLPVTNPSKTVQTVQVQVQEVQPLLQRKNGLLASDTVAKCELFPILDALCVINGPTVFIA